MAIIVCVAIALTWLATGERSVGWLAPMIEKRLAANAPGLRFEVGEALMSFKPSDSALNLTIAQLAMMREADGLHVVLPQVTLGLDLGALLFERFHVDHILIKEPTLSLSRTSDGGLQLGSDDTNNNESSAIAPALASWFATGKFGATELEVGMLLLEQVNLSIRDENTGLVWSAPGAEISLVTGEDGKVQGRLNATMTLANADSSEEGARPMSINLDGWAQRGTGQGEANIALQQITADTLSHMHPALAYAKGIQTQLDGTIRLGWSENRVEWLNAALESGKGHVENPEIWQKPWDFEKLRLKLDAAEKGRVWLLETTLNTHGTSINVKSAMERGEEEQFAIRAEADAGNFPAQELEAIWPLTVAPKARAWVIKHIHGGTVRKATASLSLPQGKWLSPEHVLPEGFFTGEVEVVGADVDYFDGLPGATDVNGTLHFADRQFTIDLTAGRLGEAQLNEGRLEIPDLSAHVYDLTLDLKLEGSAAEVGRYINRPFFPSLKGLNLNPATMRGTVKGDIRLHIPVASEGMSAPPVEYQIEAQSQNLAIPALLDKWKIENANAALSLTRQEVKVVGPMKLFGQPTELNLRYDTPKAIAEYDISMNTTQEALTAMGIALPPLFQGTAKLKARIREGKELFDAKITADLGDATIHATALGYAKPKGTAANLSLQVKRQSKQWHLSPLDYTSGTDRLKGSATLDDSQSLQSLTLDQVKLGKTNLTANISRDGRLWRVNVQGEQFDVGAAMDGPASSADPAPWPDIEIEGTLKQLYFSEGNSLNQASIQLLCENDRCQDADISATLPASGGRLALSIAAEQGVRLLKMTAPDAGELIKILGISDNIVGGELNLSGNFADDQPKHPLQGELNISAYKTLRAPVLAKMLNVASLTGIGELLQGEGIAFDGMTIPFSYQNGVISVKDGKTSGSSLGLTVGGVIDTNKDQLNLEGTLVPSYALNSFFGKIPILGTLLTGGEGQGVFGFNYSVTGPTESPDMSVNPLSVLTPGFLRNLFSGRVPDSVEGEEAPAIRPANNREP